MDVDQGEQMKGELKTYSTFVVISDKCVQDSKVDKNGSDMAVAEINIAVSRAELNTRPELRAASQTH
jgi:hypothetical protein